MLKRGKMVETKPTNCFFSYITAIRLFKVIIHTQCFITLRL